MLSYALIKNSVSITFLKKSGKAYSIALKWISKIKKEYIFYNVNFEDISMIGINDEIYNKDIGKLNLGNYYFIKLINRNSLDNYFNYFLSFI